MAHRSRRPKYLLKLRAVMDDQIEAASKHNANKCPLLSVLSAELRSRIYGYVLGNNDSQVHVDWYPATRTSNNGVWLLAPPSIQHGSCVTTRHHHDPDTKTYKQAHSYCFGPNSTVRRLAILQTCRQIHSEAALIPFTQGKYIVDSRAFTMFMRSLLKVQKAAIKHPTLVITAGTLPINGQITKLDLQGLTGVEHLTLVINDNISHFDLQNLGNLARLPLKTVNIQPISAHAFYHARGGNIAAAGVVQTAADALKVRLLGDWVEILAERLQIKEARSLR